MAVRLNRTSRSKAVFPNAGPTKSCPTKPAGEAPDLSSAGLDETVALRRSPSAKGHVGFQKALSQWNIDTSSSSVKRLFAG
jgi:hypothetical protein